MRSYRLSIKANMLMALALLFCTAAANPDSVRLEIRASPKATLVTGTEAPSAAMDKLEAAEPLNPPLVTPSLTDVYLTSPAGTYRLDANGFWWDESLSHRLKLPRSLSRRLSKQSRAMRKHHYGELMAWEDAKRIIPRKSTFAITDVETGLTFRVQNRAGSDHADVQPLTKEDTRIMSLIYDQGWSWRRKAIIVTAGDRRIAASMNGKPHGGDGIPGNGFSGHFCVHFLGSSTHRSEHPDPIHQLMVHKAAGKLRSYLDESSPDRLAQSLIIALDHRETETIRMIAEGMDARRFALLAAQAQKLSAIRLSDPSSTEPEASSGLLAYEMDRRVSAIYLRGGRRNDKLHMIFTRPSLEAPWRLLEVNPWTRDEVEADPG
ncbi:hypothetical protein COLU111180_15035 [Cohnella lubricantis]|uniref:Uncharacterized protein n=1 Tax=Cohnella lubricantis TaxID=2163172 RepID=A0A841T8R2_9BACL|nr:hypothetical protein [Cohnella lubricantis]MBB6677893.1 hypothetical protein [Cohnella lubricantis]MBP2119076.1 hypothetical protein [Cohnella lubricantis]